MPASPPKEVVVLGAGGHAKVVIELLQAAGYEIAALLDADPTPRQVLGHGVQGDDRALDELRRDGLSLAFVAIGDNRRRVALAEAVRAAGFSLVNAVSPSATVSPSAHLGEGVAIMAGAVVNAEVTLGDLCIVNTGATLDHEVSVGMGAHIAPGVAISGNVKVGDLAMMGVGSCAIQGVSIGKGAMVGAGAAVVRDIPDGALAVGVPARVRRQQADA